MKYYSIGQIAQLSECSVQLVRHYENIELITKPERTAANRRIYHSAHLKELQFIRHGRSLGFSIEDIKSLSKLKDEPYHNDQVHHIAIRHLQKVDQRIQDLQSLQETLQSIVHQCAQTAGKQPCPIIQLLDDHKEDQFHHHKPSPL